MTEIVNAVQESVREDPRSYWHLFEEKLACLLSPKRFSHSLRTAREALRLCRMPEISRLFTEYKTPLERDRQVFLAGLLHDVARERKKTTLKRWASRLDGFETKGKDAALLHAAAGAVFLKEEWGIEDESLLKAVRYHTTGSSCMDPLAKIIYVADYTEPGRTHVDRNFRELLEKENLDGKVLLVAKQNLLYLQKKELPVDSGTLEMIRDLESPDKAEVVMSCG